MSDLYSKYKDEKLDSVQFSCNQNIKQGDQEVVQQWFN